MVRNPPALNFHAHGQQVLDIASAISVVVAKLDFRGGCDSGGAHLGEKLLGTCDAAEDNGRRKAAGEDELPLIRQIGFCCSAG